MGTIQDQRETKESHIPIHFLFLAKAEAIPIGFSLKDEEQNDISTIP